MIEQHDLSTLALNRQLNLFKLASPQEPPRVRRRSLAYHGCRRFNTRGNSQRKKLIQAFYGIGFGQLNMNQNRNLTRLRSIK